MLEGLTACLFSDFSLLINTVLLSSVGSNASLIMKGEAEVPCTYRTYGHTNSLCLEVFSLEEHNSPLKAAYVGTRG